MSTKKRGSRSTIIFLACTLAVPTVAVMMGVYGGRPTLQTAMPALVTGALLGAAHLVLRPVLRLVFAPVGCLTLGLSGIAIDVGLIYGCARFVDGFEVLSLPFALITALFINVICFVVSGRK